MGSRPGTERRIGLGGIAAAGILLSHWVAYQLIAPDPHARSALLDATGHRYFAFVAALLIGVAVMGISGSLLTALRRPDGVATGTPALLALTAIQVVGFVGLESFERIVSGGAVSLLELPSEPVFLVGIALQALVAALNLRVLLGFVHTIAAIARGRTPRSRAATAPVSLPILIVSGPSDPWTGAAGLRGPPIHA